MNNEQDYEKLVDLETALGWQASTELLRMRGDSEAAEALQDLELLRRTLLAEGPLQEDRSAAKGAGRQKVGTAAVAFAGVLAMLVFVSPGPLNWQGGVAAVLVAGVFGPVSTLVVQRTGWL